MEAYVYETVNLVNGRRYIGVHKAKKFDEGYKGSGKILIQAINKYGWDNFETKILKEFDDPKEALRYEAEVIEKLKADTDPLYYNICRGGGQGFFHNGVHIAIGAHKTEEVKKRISEANTGRVRIRKGDESKRVHPDEVESYLSQGWEEGTPESSLTGLKYGNPGRIWITNGESNKMIFPEDFPYYESHGYWKECRSQKLSGRIRITNGVENKMIYPNEFEKYKKLGYRKGLTKNEPKFHLTSTKWINNGSKNRRVPSDKLEEFIENGWNLGQLRSVKHKTL